MNAPWEMKPVAKYPFLTRSRFNRFVSRLRNSDRGLKGFFDEMRSCPCKYISTFVGDGILEYCIIKRTWNFYPLKQMSGIRIAASPIDIEWEEDLYETHLEFMDRKGLNTTHTR